MNLKDFKKVSEDNEKAVLQNKCGHSFTIAKKALHKEHLAALKNLPLHAARGDVIEDPTAGLSDEANASNAETGLPETAPPPPTEANEPVQNFMSQESQYPGPLQHALDFVRGGGLSTHHDRNLWDKTGSDQDKPSSAGTETPPPSDPTAGLASQPEEGQQATQQEKPPVTQQEHFENLNNETNKFAFDLANGHIKPETMQDLYGKKDTLGKVGTLFGLLLSGAGSGLSGQPNAVMQMMNNEINNDLDAQKATATNKQNLLRLNIDNQFNKAKVGLTKADTELAWNNAKIAGTELTKSQLMLTYLKKQMNEINKMSNTNPQKASALQTMNGLTQVAGQEIQQNHAKAAAQMGPVNYEKLNQLEVQSELKIPGVKGMPTPNDIHEATKEAGSLEEARAMRNDFNDSFNALDKMFLAGNFSPHARDSYVQSLAGKLAKASAGRYNQQEAQNQINSMIPQKGDWKQTREIRRENNGKFFDILESGTPTLNRFDLKNAPDSGGRPGAETKKIGNETYTKVPGGWKRVGSK